MRDFFLNKPSSEREDAPEPSAHDCENWYRYLLEERVTHNNSVPGDLLSPLELIKTRGEESGPQQDWPAIYQLIRKKGRDMEKKTFCFKLVNSLLGCKERMAQLLAQASPPVSSARPHSQWRPHHTTFSTVHTIEKPEWQSSRFKSF